MSYDCIDFNSSVSCFVAALENNISPQKYLRSGGWVAGHARYVSPPPQPAPSRRAAFWPWSYRFGRLT